MKNYLELTTAKKANVVILIILLSLIVTTAGYFYYSNEENTIRQEKYDELKAIAFLKVSQLLQWRKERSGDAFVVSHSSYFVKGVELWFKNKNNIKYAEDIKELFNTVKKQYGYKDIFLSSVNGDILLSTDSNLNVLDSLTVSNVIATVRGQNIVHTDFYFCNLEKIIHYDIIAPLINEKGRTTAAIILRIDPNDYIYPLIQKWPTSSKTSETLLLRKEGNSVLFLNELRHKKNTALALKISLAQKDVPAVATVEGYTGIFDGVDYRGANVLAYVSPVEGTNWFMVAKIDKSELYAEIYQEAFFVFGFVLLLILVLSSGLFFLYSISQKNIYKKLWSTEEEFRTTLYSIGDAVIITDTNSNLKYMNQVAEKLTGWKEQDAKGKKLEEVFEIINEDTMLKVENSVQKVLKEGTLAGLTNHTLVISKEGRKIPIMESGAPIKSEDGKIMGVVLVFRDQTKEREAQQKLSDSETKFRNIFEKTFEGICVTDVEEKIVLVNPRMGEILGYTEAELIGMRFRDLIPDEQIKDHLLRIENRKNNISETYERSLIKKKGTTICAFISSTPLFNSNGNYDGSFGMFTDITENKLAEEEIRKLYRGVEQSPAVIMITDIRGNIEYVNPKFNEVTGYSYAEVIGKNPRILKSGTRSEEEYKNIWNTILSGNEWKGEFLNKKKSGELYWESSSISPIKTETGKITHFIAIKEDITDQKRLMNELTEAKEKAEEMNKVKSNFFANMSHELRTPFVGIMGYASMLREKLINQEEIEMVDGILEGSKRLTDTLTKILDVTKLEFAKTEIIFEEVNIVDIIDEVYFQFVKAAEIKNLAFHKKVHFESLVIMTDEKLLTEILNNLVSNAVKYTDEGWIEISGEIERKNKNEVLILKVADTGIGIPKDKEEIIWQEFRQVSEGATRSFQGTGLGLSIAKKYTELLSGKIYLQNHEGKGSTFVVELPVTKI